MKSTIGCFVFTLIVVHLSLKSRDVKPTITVVTIGNRTTVTTAANIDLIRMNHILSRGYIAELEQIRGKLLETNVTVSLASRDVTVLDGQNHDTFMPILRELRKTFNTIWFNESEKTMASSIVTKYYDGVVNQCSIYKRKRPCLSRPEDVEESHPFSDVIKRDYIAGYYTAKVNANATIRYNLTYIIVTSGALVTGEGDVIKDEYKIVPMCCRHNNQLLHYFKPEQSYARYREVLVLSQFWGEGFFHFLIENLTRIAAYLPFLMRHPHIKIHVQRTGGFTRDLLAALGIEPSRLVTGDILADVVYMPAGTPCGHATLFTAQLLSLHLRSLLPEPAPPRDTIILIKRSEKRWFNYHDDILGMLRRHADTVGLNTVVYGDDPVPGIDDTLRLFSRAYIVVAPHGAGLSNLLFSQPGTIVIEGMCYDYTGELNWCYSSLMETLGHRHCGLLFEKQCMNITADDVEPFVKYYVDKLKC